MCYAAAVPFLIWALLISVGLSADGTRVPFLLVEAVAVVISIRGLREKYRRHMKVCPDCAETVARDAGTCRYCGFHFGSDKR